MDYGLDILLGLTQTEQDKKSFKIFDPPKASFLRRAGVSLVYNSGWTAMGN